MLIISHSCEESGTQEKLGCTVLALDLLGCSHLNGQQVHNFDQKIWDENKYQIMFDANYYKFTQNPELKSELLFTEDAILAEASPYDKIWGIGLSTQGIKGLYQDIGAWKGENLLGKVLMDVREKIRREEM